MDKDNTRHIQLLKTQELPSIKLIEKSNRTVRRLIQSGNTIPGVVAENLVEDLSKEIIRLRRSLINERTHRKRLAAGLIPRLRSKCNEVRTLRQKLYGHETRIKEKNSVKTTKIEKTEVPVWALNGSGQ